VSLSMCVSMLSLCFCVSLSQCFSLSPCAFLYLSVDDRRVSKSNQVNIPVALLEEKNLIYSKRAFLHPVELDGVKYIALLNEEEIEEHISLGKTVEDRRDLRAITKTASIGYNRIYIPFTFLVPGSLVGIREAPSGKGILISYDTTKNEESTPQDLQQAG